jgi:nucleotidyltransferase substrate binding protein (TIGR01987 family)
LIQAFEYTHEMAWNTLKDFLEERGAGNLYGSRDATREAFRAGLIENGDTWMDMIKSRNLISHIHKITGVLARYPQVEQTVLYGSRAKGNYKNGSDIDMTLSGGKDLNLNISTVSWKI